MSSAYFRHDMLSFSISYEFYSSFTIWPEEVRSDLRAGVKAKQQGNFALSRRLLIQCVVCIIGIEMVTHVPEKSA